MAEQPPRRATLGPVRHHYHPDPEKIRHLLETSLEWKAQHDAAAQAMEGADAPADPDVINDASEAG